MDKGKYDIPKHRKTMFNIGTGLVGLGFILFLVPFFGVASSMSMEHFDRDMSQDIGLGLVGFVMITGGSILRSFGKYGAAGSGATLNPKQARTDLSPHAKVVGELIGDALEEVGSVNKEVVKIRCNVCKALNDDDAKYCKSCSHEL